MQAITIGTCGWSYKDWDGNFYPSGMPAADYLGYYARQFQVVEVDSTFYRPPSPKMVQTWKENTPAGFRFALKVPQVITHEKMLVDCDEETQAFTAVIQALEDKLLCAALQFGYLNKQAFVSQKAFLQRLDGYLAKWPKGVPVAVEVRNRTWMNEQLAACLRKHGAIWILPEQAWMPHPFEIVQKVNAVTGSFAYVRLLGDREAIEQRTDVLDRVVIDRTQELAQTARAIVELAGRVPVVAFINNHYAGHGPTIARQLQEAVSSDRIGDL